MARFRHRLHLLGLSLVLIATLMYTVGSKNNETLDTELEGTVLHLLVYAPYPSPIDGGWDGGISVIPAVRLALSQINNSPTLLSGYRLEAVEDDSGCQVETTAVSSFFHNVYYRGLNIIGTIGPGCSKSTLLLAPILSRPQVSLVQVAPSATSPEIERLNQRTTYTMRAPMNMVSNTVDLLSIKSWRRCATLYDQERAIHTTLHNAFVNMTKNSSDIKVEYISSIVDERDEKFFPIAHLQQSKLRIIIVFTESITARRIMCLASKRSMVYPTYQWIFIERSINEVSSELEPFTIHSVLYNCSREELETAFYGAIITQYSLNRTSERESVSPLNISYAEYRNLYTKELYRHIKETPVQELIKAVNETEESFVRNDNWENVYYDATWAFGLALNGVISRGVDLTDYQHGQDSITEILLEEFFKVQFEGASGHIEFTPERNVLSRIDTKQVISATAVQTVSLCSRVAQNTSCNRNFSAIEVLDSFGEDVQRVHIAVGVLVILIAVVLVGCTAYLHVVFMVFGDWKSIKATSPDISHLIFSGCYLYSLAAILYMLQQVIEFDSLADGKIIYGVFCNTIVWCVTLGASLIFGTMLAKVWRIFKLFRHFRNKRPGVFLSDAALTLAVLVLVAIDCAFCVCWNTIDPYQMGRVPVHDFVFDVEERHTDIQINLECRCNDISVWLGIVIGLKAPIVILLVIFATLNRKISRKHFSHTKKVNILIYCLTITCGVGFSITLIVGSVSVYVSLVFCTVMLVTVSLCCALLFVPPIVHLSNPPSPSRTSRSRQSSRLS